MKRRLLNLVTGLSLLLCVAVCVLWGRSYVAVDRLRVFKVPRVWSLLSADGRLCVAGRKVNQAALDVPVHADRRFAFDTDPGGEQPSWADDWPDWGGRGLQWTRHTGMTEWQWRLWLPHGWLAVALLAPPSWRVVARQRRHRRLRRGLCFRCGYDLTGNVTGVCPECGATASVGERIRSSASSG
jgi:hypothetical protein